MAENKTKPTDASIEGYLDSRANERQRADCMTLMAMFERLTGETPRMWGPSIVGYGAYRYTYDSGRAGEAPLAGFAIRGRELVVYLSCDDEAQAGLFSRLGKHRMTTSCLYFKQLADLDIAVLERLVAASIDDVKQRYG